MPRKKIHMIEAWSNSRFATYDQCPAKAKYQYIDKLKTETNAAMQRGRDIHTYAEMYVKGKIQAMPNELELFDVEFDQLRKMFKAKTGPSVNPELQWAFKKDWTPCEWFGPTTWCRIMIDCFVHNKKENRATVIDYKTGKIRDGYDIQLELYAAGAFALFPELEEVKTELWYLDQGEIRGGDEKTGEGVFTNEDGDRLIAEWNKRVKPMLNDKAFAPKPNNLCHWCDFSNANGGPCEY